MSSDIARVRPARRVRVGRDLHLIAECDDGLEFEGVVRLSPGLPVEVIDECGNARRALVASWTVARLEHGGPVYRGQCRWDG